MSTFTPSNYDPMAFNGKKIDVFYSGGGIWVAAVYIDEHTYGKVTMPPTDDIILGIYEDYEDEEEFDGMTPVEMYSSVYGMPFSKYQIWHSLSFAIEENFRRM